MNAAKEEPLTPQQVQEILFRQHFVRIPGTVELLYNDDQVASYSAHPVLDIFNDLVYRAEDDAQKTDLTEMRHRLKSILPHGRSNDTTHFAHGIPYQVSGEVTDRLRPQPLGPEEAEAVAPAAKETLEDSLARLFIRLGPPPEPTNLDYTPAGRGGGGATQ